MSREEGQPCRGVGAGLLSWLPPAGAWKTGAVCRISNREV